jgi:hypothetical protein
MFNFFRRDPIREAAKELNMVLQIPVELIAVTAETFAAADAALARAGLRKRFSEEALFAEICAYHVKTVILTINRVAGVAAGAFAPGVEEAYDRSARSLVKTIPQLLDDMRSRGLADTELMKVLIADKTIEMAAEYYVGIQLEVSEEDVLEFARKYNPKLLSLNSDDRANPIFAYIIRAIRISHIEDLPSQEARTAAVVELNDVLFKAVLELESKVEKLAPKG